VPAEERLRAYQERRPALARQDPARRRHQDPVEPAKPGALHPAPQDRELVAEYGVLDLESALARLAAGDPEPPAKHRVEEGEEHRRMVRSC
jgi:hypothetical protein